MLHITSQWGMAAMEVQFLHRVSGCQEGVINQLREHNSALRNDLVPLHTCFTNAQRDSSLCQGQVGVRSFMSSWLDLG